MPFDFTLLSAEKYFLLQVSIFQAYYRVSVDRFKESTAKGEKNEKLF